MGFYLEVPGTVTKNKAQLIQQLYNAVPVSQEQAEQIVKTAQQAVVCVVENPTFDAAAFCHSPEEFNRFSHPMDDRKKTWLMIHDRAMVEKLTNFQHR